MDDAETLDLQVLDALVEGFRARAGAKERHQALSEYEVARRVGVVGYSYVEYENSREREAVRSALSRLQRRGLARAVSLSGRYETFVPTERAESEIDVVPEAIRNAVREVAGRPDEPAPDAPAAQGSTPAEPPASEAPLPTTFEGRFDEIIRLLRSIDAHLARITRE